MLLMPAFTAVPREQRGRRNASAPTNQPLVADEYADDG
jgi:hypothetical protein